MEDHQANIGLKAEAVGRAAERNSVSQGHGMGRKSNRDRRPEKRYIPSMLHGSLRILDWEGRGVVDLCLRSFICRISGLMSGHVEWAGSERS